MQYAHVKRECIDLDGQRISVAILPITSLSDFDPRVLAICFSWRNLKGQQVWVALWRYIPYVINSVDTIQWDCERMLDHPMILPVSVASGIFPTMDPDDYASEEILNDFVFERSKPSH